MESTLHGKSMGGRLWPKALSAVPLSSRQQFNYCDKGLSGLAGAQEIISLLVSYRIGVTKIDLNHNWLGDDGTCHLFAYLSSAEGSKHRATVSEISLVGNDIGSKGLRAIIEFIRGNDVLRTLKLANNDLISDSDIASNLAVALNNSKIRLLSLSTNTRLGDTFVEHFLPSLRSQSLQELHINSMGLTARSAPTIAAWIRGNRTSSSQGRCCLQTFKCSGNNLGISGVREIIRAIQEGNWTLTNVEMYANQLAEPLRHLGVEDPSSVSSTASSTSGQLHGVREPVEEWKDCEQGLHTVIMRNVHWKRRIEKEALCLLRYARPVLMPSGPSITIASPQDPSNPPSPPVKDPPFSKELREYILALFAPSLSPAQRIRVYNYASDPATLPPLLPSLRRETRKECLADPSSLGATFGTTKYNPGCQDGKCMGAGNSLICRREMEQSKFLETVGCCSYEPE